MIRSVRQLRPSARIIAFAASSAIAAAATTASGGAQVTHTPQTSGTNALLIAVSPVNDRVVWVSGSQGTYVRTTDGGTTWKAGRVPGADSLQFRDVHAFDANNAYLLSIGNGNQSRIYKTSDAGANWTLQFTNPDSAGFYDCMDFWDAKRGIVIGDALGADIAILDDRRRRTLERAFRRRRSRTRSLTRVASPPAARVS